MRWRTRAASFSESADSAMASELFGVAGVIELARFLEPCEDNLGEEFAVGATKEFRFHFVDGMSTAHEDAEGVVVEVLFGFEFARLCEHEKKMRQGRKDVKRLEEDCGCDAFGRRV